MNKIKSLLVVLLAIGLLAGISLPCYAANTYNLTKDYQDIWVATGNNGINSHIWVKVTNSNSLHHTDIRMLNKNGVKVWEEYGAIDYSSQRQFWCGSNVYRLQARKAAKNIVGDLTAGTAVCSVWK